MMFTLRCATSSTGSGMNTSARSAVAPRAVSAGGVAVVGPEPAAAAENMLKSLQRSWCCTTDATGAVRLKGNRIIRSGCLLCQNTACSRATKLL